MTELAEITQCPNCGADEIGNYCSNCGQKIYRKRFTIRGFFEVVGNALNFEKGFIHTMLWMFLQPGKVVNDYLNGKTKSYINPLNYILVIAGVYAFLVLWLDILDQSIETTNHLIGGDKMPMTPETLEMQNRAAAIAKDYVNFIPLILIPFASIFSKWFYYKRKLYYGEHLILLTFVFAQTILISVIVAPFTLIIPGLSGIFTIISIGYSLFYFSYAMYRIFKQSVFKAITGAFVIYIGGYIFFMLFIMVIIALVLFILKLAGFNPADLVQ